MKKYVTIAALGLLVMLTFSTSFAAGKNNEKKLIVPLGATVTKLKSGIIVIDGNTTTAYDKKYNMVYSIQRYSAENIPLDVFKKVRANYGNYYIAGIEKIEQPGKDSEVVVHMQNDKDLKTVKLNLTNTDTNKIFTNN